MLLCHQLLFMSTFCSCNCWLGHVSKYFWTCSYEIEMNKEIGKMFKEFGNCANCYFWKTFFDSIMILRYVVLKNYVLSNQRFPEFWCKLHFFNFLKKMMNQLYAVFCIEPGVSQTTHHLDLYNSGMTHFVSKTAHLYFESVFWIFQ